MVRNLSIHVRISRVGGLKSWVGQGQQPAGPRQSAKSGRPGRRANQSPTPPKLEFWSCWDQGPESAGPAQSAIFLRFAQGPIKAKPSKPRVLEGLGDDRRLPLMGKPFDFPKNKMGDDRDGR